MNEGSGGRGEGPLSLCHSRTFKTLTGSSDPENADCPRRCPSRPVPITGSVTCGVQPEETRICVGGSQHPSAYQTVIKW